MPLFWVILFNFFGIVIGLIVLFDIRQPTPINDCYCGTAPLAGNLFFNYDLNLKYVFIDKNI